MGIGVKTSYEIEIAGREGDIWWRVPGWVLGRDGCNKAEMRKG